ncbi:hypothetical protein Gpo141_00002997, partial [Globisporangium polare]
MAVDEDDSSWSGDESGSDYELDSADAADDSPEDSRSSPPRTRAQAGGSGGSDQERQEKPSEPNTSCAARDLSGEAKELCEAPCCTKNCLRDMVDTVTAVLSGLASMTRDEKQISLVTAL